MTDAEVKAISEVLTYLVRLVVDVRKDTKAMREAETKSRSAMAQELRRLRERVARLNADSKSYRKIRNELERFIDPAPPSHAHTKAIHKDFKINKNNPK